MIRSIKSIIYLSLIFSIALGSLNFILESYNLSEAERIEAITDIKDILSGDINNNQSIFNDTELNLHLINEYRCEAVSNYSFIDKNEFFRYLVHVNGKQAPPFLI